MENLLKKRKAFNFYRSYYDLFTALPVENRLDFITAILEKQFEGIEPNLEGITLLAYAGQKHNIDSQVEGFLNKTRATQPPSLPPSVGGTYPPLEPPSVQEKEKEKEKEKEQVKEKEKVEKKNKYEEYMKSLDIDYTSIEDQIDFGRFNNL